MDLTIIVLANTFVFLVVLMFFLLSLFRMSKQRKKDANEIIEIKRQVKGKKLK